ncbi:SpoIIE family protein phosphatase, partial [Lutispora sp.]|uniref:SpoIIE family protein phosphatase n=1 Tax=Lutispora sp. TaxID=2828727 RepID=UPI003561ABD6
MNDLCTDVGYASINKFGEQLCGDHVEVVAQGENSTVVVLADGLGSGVKANILSILTAKIISTMMANELSVRDCVTTIAATLPICKIRRVAYSTFTIIRIENNLDAEIIQYDNPHVILLRKGKSIDYPKTLEIIDNKTIYKSKIKLDEDDTFIALSDGAIHAGVGISLNFGWQRGDIIKYIENIYEPSLTAKTLSTMLLNEC